MLKNSFALLACLIVNLVTSQTASFCQQIEALQNLVKEKHYTAKGLDDKASKSIQDLFLEKLDESNKLFIQEDIDAFSLFDFQLDSYILNKDCEFIKEYQNRLEKRIQEAKKVLNSFKTLNLDYSGKDTLYFDAKRPFTALKSEAEFRLYWNKRLRYKIIVKLIENDSVLGSIRQNFKSSEKDLKLKIIDNEICLLSEIENQNGGIRSFVEESFLNAYLKYQDPNSTFFNNADKTIFESSVANSQLSFGISTRKNNNGDIVIAYITPGSPAFKHGGFEVNDVITSLKSNSKTLQTYCVSNNDILEFINDEDHFKISFGLRKQNGGVEHHNLTKSVVDVEDNNIRGYIIDGDKSIGYIKIPSFYTDLESPNGLGVANDVAKELYKLKKDGIHGLIIDLRFNGGGSMKEAADLSGMFINRGPLSIIKYANGETFTIRDSKRGSVFNKPIVILVNSFSASASEFFAGAMQDYNRAIVVGSQTHGKSSAQIIFPLGKKQELGFAKLTVEKFYKPSGSSHQSIGVIPDVVLPSIYDDFKSSEQYSKYPLINDTVKTTLKLVPLKKSPISALKENSSKRLLDHIGFNKVSEMNNQLLNQYVNKKNQFALTLDNIYNDRSDYENLWNDFRAFNNNLKLNLIFKNHSTFKELLNYNDAMKKENVQTLKELASDIYIEEAQYILTDLITLNNSN